MQVDLTAEFLKGLKKKAEVAEEMSPSPWHTFEDDSGLFVVDDAKESMVCLQCSEVEADFIVAADPATVLAMISEIEHLRCKNAELLDIIHRNILLPEYNDEPSRS